MFSPFSKGGKGDFIKSIEFLPSKFIIRYSSVLRFAFYIIPSIRLWWIRYLQSAGGGFIIRYSLFQSRVGLCADRIPAGTEAHPILKNFSHVRVYFTNPKSKSPNPCDIFYNPKLSHSPFNPKSAFPNPKSKHPNSQIPTGRNVPLSPSKKNGGSTTVTCQETGKFAGLAELC